MVVTNPTLPAGKLGPAWGGRGYSRGLKATGLGFRRAQVLVLHLLVSLGLSFRKSSHRSIYLASYDRKGMGLPVWMLSWGDQLT